ncbi:MAG TPA: FAD-binding oxidoreductase [Anaerolineales bacterium]|nr:FAD-binding oxidoreductase [Anaerolineales bacterium]
MTRLTADVVICGAGIAGIASAYHLACVHGVRDILLIDERPPLSLTSDKSTECYRNWWPGPGEAMVSLMNRSIDLLDSHAERSGNVFHLNRRGYLFATGDPARIPQLEAAGREAADLGAGSMRWHRGRPEDPDYQRSPAAGYKGQPDGSDLITDPGLLRREFPYLSPQTVAAIHPRRCGWFSAQQLGMYWLEEARARGARVLQARIEAVETEAGRVARVKASSAEGEIEIDTRTYVVAAGPLLPRAAAQLGVSLPVFAEYHAKVAMADPLGIVPRDAPLLIWADPQVLPWTEAEAAELESSEATRWMLDEFPSGVHARPEGPDDSPIILILWTYHTQPVEPVFPAPVDPYLPEIALRGLSTMIPGLQAYFGRPPRPYVDGGYYLKTRENRPLIGPLPVEGSFVIGALSGFGLMAAAGAGELLAAWVTNTQLPKHAAAFQLERYEDPEYQKLLQSWGSSGQL